MFDKKDNAVHGHQFKKKDAVRCWHFLLLLPIAYVKQSDIFRKHKRPENSSQEIRVNNMTDELIVSASFTRITVAWPDKNAPLNRGCGCVIERWRTTLGQLCLLSIMRLTIDGLGFRFRSLSEKFCVTSLISYFGTCSEIRCKSRQFVPPMYVSRQSHTKCQTLEAELIERTFSRLSKFILRVRRESRSCAV